MQKELSITVKAQDEKNEKLIQTLLEKELKNQNIDSKKHEVHCIFSKKSIDARHGQVKIHLKYKIYVDEQVPEQGTDELPQWKKLPDESKKVPQVVIVGSGPAGLFGALKLIELGIRPIIIERGEETSERKKTIAKISTQGKVNEDSNYCFGEGGAGTFSDGKLYTRSNKRGNISRILQIFVKFGANPLILTDAHPHIGTEKLPTVINEMKKFIIELGGKFFFNTRCIDFIKEGDVVKGIVAKNTVSGEQQTFLADAVLLATGHSALDIYELLAQKNPKSLESKTFAAGVRVEHPRTLIDSIQYHGQKEMGAAEYRLTTQVEERGVYSFCMCPGGVVVPSATSENQIVVNGMSSSTRNSNWSNAAIVTEIRPEDIPEEFVHQAKGRGCAVLAGLLFRNWLESETKQNGQGQKAPAQLMTDFLAHKQSKDLPQTSYTPGVVSSRLDIWLPDFISARLAQGFLNFGKNMKGFVSKQALLIASETRTSTPVRILREAKTLESPVLKNLYPCGEGSGYSGGIVSSAMDGESTCATIAKKLLDQ